MKKTSVTTRDTTGTPHRRGQTRVEGILYRLIINNLEGEIGGIEPD